MTGNADQNEAQAKSLRDHLHEFIFEADTKAGSLFDIGLIIAILASVIVVMLSTLKTAQEEPQRTTFLAIEWAFTLVFTAEYLLRIAVARRPLRYIFSPFGIIDLLSILPAFIGLFIPGGERLLVVRVLRLLRVFRVLKLARYLHEATALRGALWQSRHKITVFLTTVLIVVVITGALMHIVEGGSNEDFESMPRAMYWAIITMSTVGYGDITPTTVFGQFITAAPVLIGYSMTIVPTGILSAEIATRRSKSTVGNQCCSQCMKEDHDPDAKFCKHCGTGL